MSETTQVRTSAQPPVPEEPSGRRGWRDRGQWSVVVVLPLVLAVATMAVEDVRSAVRGLFTSPPGLAATAPEGLAGCVNEYFAMPEERLRRSLGDYLGMSAGVAMVRRAGDELQEDPVLGVTLQAPSAAAIVVTGATAEVLSTRPLPTGGTVLEPIGCGGTMAKRAFDVRLGGRGSTVRPVAGAPDFPFKVAGADPEYLEFQVHTDLPRDVRFRLRVRWVSQGEAGESVLDDGGKGFRLLGPNRLPSLRPAGS